MRGSVGSACCAGGGRALAGRRSIRGCHAMLKWRIAGQLARRCWAVGGISARRGAIEGRVWRLVGQL